MGRCCSFLKNDPERIPLKESAAPRPDVNDRSQKTYNLNQHFEDIAETFNKQQEHYNKMNETLKTISGRYRLSTNASLSQCLRKMEEEHGQQHIGLKVRGYNFTLEVTSQTGIPDKLKTTQKDITELSTAAKRVMSLSPKLLEMIYLLLKDETTIIRQVEEGASCHQERRRLVDNLKKNIEEVKKDQEKCQKYRNEAKDLMTEALNEMK